MVAVWPPHPDLAWRMFESLKGIVSALKEGAVEAGAKAYLNEKIQAFGTITNLQLDPRRKTIACEISLKGEPLPVSVKVGAYEITCAGGTTYITLRQFEASREWIAAVLNQYVAGQPLQVPSAVAGVL